MVEAILAGISPDCPRKEWVLALSVVKASAGEAGRDAAEKWSQGSNKYRSTEFDSTWRSIKVAELPPDPESLLQVFEMTDAEAKEIASPNEIIKNLVIETHMTAICAEPNGGKTAIAWHLAPQMVKKGYQVWYINCDIGAADAVPMSMEARETGVRLLLPDMKVGKSVADVVEVLERLNATQPSLAKVVFILDTLKKFTDMINKANAKRFLQLLRSMTGKGATVISLCHTNKYKDVEGKPIFEGVGDIRSDHDELIYLIPQKRDNGSMLVSTLPDKVRADIKPITFEIGADRRVRLLDQYVNVAEDMKQSIQQDKDHDAIERIFEAIEQQQIKQCDIVKYCKGHGINHKRTPTVLKRYANKSGYWVQQRGMDHNTLFYYMPDTAPPEQGVKGERGKVNVER